MVKVAIEVISLLLFLAFFVFVMYIIIKGIWSSFGNKQEDTKLEKLTGENNVLKIENNDLKIENQNLKDRITYLENKIELEKETKEFLNARKKRTTRRHE